MKKALQAFLVLLATATDRELARQLQFMKIQNRLLRSKLPARIPVSAREKAQLVKAGRPLGSVALKELLTLVSLRTFYRWASGEPEVRKRGAGKPGRPRTAAEIRALILKLARENGWGYSRILGELRKLGVAKVSRGTVVNILKEEGLEPGPKRGEGSWDEFVTRHAKTLWATDFFSKKVWTVKGLVESTCSSSSMSARDA